MVKFYILASKLGLPGDTVTVNLNLKQGAAASKLQNSNATYTTQVREEGAAVGLFHNWRNWGSDQLMYNLTSLADWFYVSYSKVWHFV